MRWTERIDIKWKSFFLVPDPQLVLRGLDEMRDTSAISTESCHKWRILRSPIPHLNVICCQTTNWGLHFLASYIHWEEGYIDLGFIWLRYEIDTVCQIWVGIWMWRWGEDSSYIWIASSTCWERQRGRDRRVHNMKSLSIGIIVTIRKESEK